MCDVKCLNVCHNIRLKFSEVYDMSFYKESCYYAGKSCHKTSKQAYCPDYNIIHVTYTWYHLNTTKIDG